MLQKIANWIVDHRRILVIVMTILTLGCTALLPFVKINYDMTKYLPPHSSMKIGMDKMAEEFPDLTEESNIRVMFTRLREEQIPVVRKQLSDIPYVKNVDYEPGNPDYNKDDHTLFVVYTDYPYSSKEEVSIEKAIDRGFDGYEMVWKNTDVGKGVLPASVVALAMTCLMIILFAMCSSWFEPVLFAAAIGIAVLINMGSNLIQGEISDITFTIAALLQMVLSMDYSIILMNRYRQELEYQTDRVSAMKSALAQAMPSILSSGMTTVVGMIMLVFMSFRIGRDLGVVLAKGVFLSMVSVCTFLPALILATTDTIFKYNKKFFDPNMDGLARFTSRFFRPMAVLFLLLFAGSYILQARTPFSYTLFQDDPVADVFPLENQIVLLYSNEDEEAVAKIADDLMKEDHTRSVMSYSTTLARGYTVRELADVMTDMGSDTKIDPSMLRIIFYDKHSGGVLPSISAGELFTFLNHTVRNDPQFSGYLTPEMTGQMDAMSLFESPGALTRPRTAGEIARQFGLPENQVAQLLQYYAIRHPGSSSMTMTLPAFTAFLTEEVAKDPEIGSMIPADAAEQMSSLKALTDTENLTRPLTPSEAARILGVDRSYAEMLWALYGMVNGEGADASYDTADFIRFMAGQLDSNPMFAENIADDQVQQIRLLSGVLTAASAGNTLTAGVLGQTLSLSEQAVNGLLAATREDGLTVDGALDLLIANPDWGLTEDQIATFTQLRSLLKSAAFGTKHDAAEMAEILQMDESIIRFLYAYKSLSDEGMNRHPVSLADLTSALSAHSDALSGLMGPEERAQLASMAGIVQGTLSGKGYTAGELATLTGMEDEQISMLYMYYVMNHGGTAAPSVSIRDFLDFLADDVLTNPQFSSYIDGSQASRLQGARALADAVVDGTEYSPEAMSDLLGGLGADLDPEMLKLLYLYHAAMYQSDPNWTMSILELFDHLENHMMNDARFASFFDESMKAELTKNKQTLEDGVRQLKGPHYSILMLASSIPVESEETESWYQSLTTRLSKELHGDYHLIGSTPMNYEMKASFHKELTRITLLTALSIFLVVLLTFRSFLIPAILVCLVQCGVFITIATSGVLGYEAYYLSMLIVQCILMGATIDYGILFTNYYRENRQYYDLLESLKRSFHGSTHTILTSGLIIILVTGLVGFAPVDPTIGQICQTISIGTLSATLLILFVLPSLLAACDRFVSRPTIRRKKDMDPI